MVGLESLGLIKLKKTKKSANTQYVFLNKKKKNKGSLGLFAFCSFSKSHFSQKKSHSHSVLNSINGSLFVLLIINLQKSSKLKAESRALLCSPGKYGTFFILQINSWLSSILKDTPHQNENYKISKK
jgi:hypothetical protein